MEIHILSIFPEMFQALSNFGVISRAIDTGLVSVSAHDLRDFAHDKHASVDDRPYGGGPGMVMKPDVVARAIESVKPDDGRSVKVIYLSPQGQVFNHQAAVQFAQEEKGQCLIFLAGRYEGVDERVLQTMIDEEWSIGDYVLSGGELPTMVMIDAIVRLMPDSLGNDQSAEQDSFVSGLLDCPHYTRPEEYSGMKVPDVLMSGDHAAIQRWRQKQALGRTFLRRPDLLASKELSDFELQLLAEFKSEQEISD